MNYSDLSEKIIQKIHSIGIGIALDDFGTGFSSLSYLCRFPIDTLKIDKSFVQEMTTSQKDCIMVRQTIEMGHELGLQVVAEGVETPEQLHLLRSFACDSAQGYLFSRPVPAARVLQLLNASHGRRPEEDVLPSRSIA